MLFLIIHFDTGGTSVGLTPYYGRQSPVGPTGGRSTLNKKTKESHVYLIHIPNPVVTKIPAKSTYVPLNIVDQMKRNNGIKQIVIV